MRGPSRCNVSATEPAAGGISPDRSPDTNTGSNIAKPIIHIGTCNILRGRSVRYATISSSGASAPSVANGGESYQDMVGALDVDGVAPIERCDSCP